MTEKDILNLIAQDAWMMKVLHTAQSLNLPDWMIGAGFVRNKVWDHLHGFIKEKPDIADIDLIYFDERHVNKTADLNLSKEMEEKTSFPWEITNQAYTHTWHNRGPYKDTTDALADWVETATCVAVSLTPDGELKLYAPHGIYDLTNLIVRRNDTCSDAASYEHRVTSKKWKEKWPKLKIIIKAP